MLQLFFSLASPFLFLALCENERCLISFQKENRRLHLDNFLTYLKTLLNKINHPLSEINEIYFTSTPSGQTGLRISLAFLSTLQILNPKVKFYHIDTLQLQAESDNCISLLTFDRRETKFHVAVYQNKLCLLKSQMFLKEELNGLMKKFNGFSVRKDFVEVDFLTHFQKLKNEFIRLKNIAEINF
ncbi:MAG: glycoprotease [Mycoplasmataceae bacterium RC_NB112A]|nr:MAG: glycoprotease [Mycoplasmataceae bacterium RC_NB112A]